MATRKGELMTVEKKGRIMVPKEFRGNFLGKLMLTVGRECLILLTEEEWNKSVGGKLSGLIGLELRRTERVLLSSTFEVEIDNQGRISIPDTLIRHASLNPEEKAVVIKTNNRLEIWNKEKWAVEKRRRDGSRRCFCIDEEAADTREEKGSYILRT